jgi:serine protease inhibitor
MGCAKAPGRLIEIVLLKGNYKGETDNNINKRTMKMITIVLLMVLTGAVMSCSKQETSGPDEFSNLPEKSAQLINADNKFGLGLFQKIVTKAGNSDNTMISPLSISLALAMTYNGANGQTQSDMEKTLELSGLTREQINNSYKALVAALQSADPDVVLEIANAIYYRQEFNVITDFININKNFYKAAAAPLDFKSNDALKTINGWVAEKTHGKIPAILDQIDPALVMVLLNAIYFNGLWKNKFGENDTHALPFTFGNGSRMSIPQMNQETGLEYTSNDLFSAVHLPYGKGQYQMTVLLPNQGKTTGNVVTALTNDNWNLWMKSFSTKKNVEVTMPRFKFSWEMKLNDILSEMGMTSAFTPGRADFTGISKEAELYISFVIHKTFIDVNENGTEAAAVTAVGIFTTSIPTDPPGKIYFSVDRPFLFAITEKTTGTILFIGEIKSPQYN